jgi:mitogen-activated protein kinase 7
MEHPYLSQYHDAEDEPVCETPLDLDFDGDLSIEQWKQLIWDEIDDFAVTRRRKLQEAKMEPPEDQMDS